MSESVPTEAELQDFVRRQWVEKSVSPEECSAFLERCEGTPAWERVQELSEPYLHAIRSNGDARQALWYASEEPEQLRMELRKYTSDEDVIQEIIDATSLTGAMFVYSEKRLPIAGWAHSAWLLRGEGDLATVLEFGDIEDNFTVLEDQPPQD